MVLEREVEATKLMKDERRKGFLLGDGMHLSMPKGSIPQQLGMH